MHEPAMAVGGDDAKSLFHRAFLPGFLAIVGQPPSPVYLGSVDIKTSTNYHLMPMRTTLTIDNDVAVELERLRRVRDASLKDVVNDALRRGLREMAASPKR